MSGHFSEYVLRNDRMCSEPGVDREEVHMSEVVEGHPTGCKVLIVVDVLANLKVRFLAARDDLSGVGEGFASGGTGYITKSFNDYEVARRVRTQLERRELRRQLESLQAELEETCQRQIGTEPGDR